MRPGDFADGAAVHAMVLMAQITRRMSAITPPALDGVRYSNTMVRILTALDERGGTTPSELGVQLGLDRSIVSRTVTQLHTRGIVSRRVDAKDRRYVRLRLSAKGKRSIDEYIASITSAATGIAPLVIEIAESLELEDPADDASAHTSLFRSLDELAAVGSRTVAGFLSIEQAYGVSHWTQRFALWVAQDRPGVTSGDIASALGLDTAHVLAAVDQLEALGLATVRAGSAETVARAGAVTLTDAGVAIVAAESALFCEQAGELVRWARHLCRAAQPSTTDAP